MASALLALAASVYIAYLLEIVKLANPRIRRREEQARDDARQKRLSPLQARAVFAEPCGFPLLQALVCSARNGARPSRVARPAGAGAVLLGTTVAGIGVGALVGWVAGAWPIGALVGAVVGIPAGIFAVYRRYRGVFS